MSEDVLKLLAHPTNQAILNLLRVEPTYPRKIGDLISVGETEIARRLRRMEEMGFVTSGWGRVQDRNVKLYHLAADRYTIHVTPDGLHVTLHSVTAGRETTLALNPFPAHIPEPDGFVGRQSELADLAGDGSVWIVKGLPGSGKTSLVATHARNHRASGGLLWWHAMRGVESLDWLANRLAVLLAREGDTALLEAIEADAGTAERRERLLAALDHPGLLTVLEDVHQIEDPVVREWLEDAIARTRNGHLILTTRERIPHDRSAAHIQRIELEGLDDDAVGALFAAKNVPFDDALLPRVRDEVGGHPLALNLFLETVKDLECAVEELLDRIPEADLENYLLEEIHGHLDEADRRVLAHASILHGDFAPEELEAISDKDPRPALLRLRQRLLVSADDRGRYSLSEVIRNFFHNLLADKARLHERIARYLQKTGRIEDRLEAMHHHVESGHPERALKLLEEDLDLDDFDRIDAGYKNHYQRLLQQFGRKDVRSDRHWALIQDELGDIHHHDGNMEVALRYHEEAAQWFTGVGDNDRVAELAWKRAVALRELGKQEEAAILCREALSSTGGDEQTRKQLAAFAQ